MILGRKILAVLGLWTAAAVQAQPANPIRLNTVGYLPNQPKVASIALEASSFKVVRDQGGETVLEGRVTGPWTNPDSGEGLYLADFSILAQPGEYRLEVPGAGSSPPFRIADDLYRQPFQTAMLGMYLWRCGTAVQARYEGNTYSHAACHLDDAYLDFVGGGHVRRSGKGGWHDAGDYNKYVVNAGVTVGVLFRAWEDFGERIERVKPSHLPEEPEKLPAFLDEIRWEMEWLLSMQAEDGSVYHKLSTVEFNQFEMPEQEQAKRYYAPWGSAASSHFAAMAAQAARLYRPFDSQFASRCLRAAEKSYRFLLAHPEDHRPDLSRFKTGAYQVDDHDSRIWAAAELWETTGREEYLKDFEARLRAIPAQTKVRIERHKERWKRFGQRFPNRPQPDFEARAQAMNRLVDSDWDYGNLKNLAMLTYLFSQRPGRAPDLLRRVREALLQTAGEIVQAGRKHGYGRPFGGRYYWGCNGTVARQAVVLQAAYRITKQKVYLETALDALNHLLGRNYYGRSFVTGLGFQPPLHPHDRRSGADHIADPWPGYLVGGAERGASNWNDVQADYRTNEIAINWNAALIYALAGFLP